MAAIASPIAEPSAARPAPGLVTDGLLVATVLASALLLGAVQVPALIGASLLSAGAAGAAAWTDARGPGARPALAVLLALAAWTALQAMPLPVGLLSTLAPDNADVWQRAAELLGRPRSWAPISLDPGASTVEVLKLCTYANVTVAAASLGRRRGSRRVAAVLVGAGTLVAVATLAHGVTGASRVFGVYTPTVGIGPWHAGPLLNPNNLAGYLNVGILAGAGLTLLRGPLARTVVLAGCVAVMLATNFIAASRAGLAALVIGLALLVWLSQRTRGRVALVPRRRALAVSGALLVASVAMAAAWGTARSWRELLDDDFQKIAAAARMVPVVEDHAWVGIGRGAFEGVSPAYAVGPGDIVFAHAENFLLQWATEWGAPVALLALVALGWVLRPRALGLGARPPVAGVVAGAVALVLQNLLDLGLEIPGVVVLLWVGLGGCLGAAASRSSALSRAGVLALPLTTLAAVGVVVGVGMRTATVDREEIDRLIDVTGPAPADVSRARALVDAAIARHPADPYFYRAGALVAWMGGEPKPLRYLGRALERGPDSARTHYLLGVLLAARGVGHQALAETGRAALEGRMVPRAARLAVAITRDFERLRDVAPPGAAGVRMLIEMEAALPPAELETREALLEAALDRAPESVQARVRLGWLLAAQLGAEGPRCAGDRRPACEVALAAHAEALARAGRQVEALALRVEVEIAAGEADPSRAGALERELASTCFDADPRGPCLRVRLRAAAATGSRERFLDAAGVLASDACPGAERCAETLIWIARQAERAGHPAVALRYRERVAEREHTSAAAWLSVARAARGVRDRARAERALRRADALARDDAARAEIEQERGAWGAAASAP